MNDWVKYLIAGGVGYAAAIAYKQYQTEQATEQARLAHAQRTPAQRIAQTALQAGREAGLVNGMAGHMAMPAQGFYGQNGMRQSRPGNPHAPVHVPRRQAPKAPPPPPPPAPVEGGGEGGGEFESYADDGMMGGQRF